MLMNQNYSNQNQQRITENLRAMHNRDQWMREYPDRAFINFDPTKNTAGENPYGKPYNQFGPESFVSRDNQDRIKQNIERLGGIQSTIPRKKFLGKKKIWK